MQLITELKIVEGKSAKAPEGFEIIPVDLNKGAGGKYIYLCYKKKEAEVGIVDIIVLRDKKADGEGTVVPKGYTKIDYDVNKGAGGDYIYLAYKMGTAEQSKQFGITNLDIIDNGKKKLNNTPEKYKGFIIKDFDLNKGAGGSYLYLAYKNISDVSLSNWMSLLSDEQRLVDISIPGTHDTMTYSLEETIMYDLLKNLCSTGGAIGISALAQLILSQGLAGPINSLALIIAILNMDAEKLAKTQEFDLQTQLECGARFLDIRVNSTLGCHHGDYFTCCNDFRYAITCIADYLRKNNKEFVVMRLGDKDIKTEYKAELIEILESVSDVTWKKDVDSISNVTVGDLRGKIIFLYGDEFKDYVSNNGFLDDKKAEYLDYQDDYNDPEVKTKYNEITSTILNRGKDKLTINHVSAAMKNNAEGVFNAIIDNDKTPLGYANYLNPRVESFLYDKAKDLWSIGIVIYDFIGFDLAWAVIKHNFGI